MTFPASFTKTWWPGISLIHVDKPWYMDLEAVLIIKRMGIHLTNDGSLMVRVGATLPIVLAVLTIYLEPTIMRDFGMDFWHCSEVWAHPFMSSRYNWTEAWLLLIDWRISYVFTTKQRTQPQAAASEAAEWMQRRGGGEPNNPNSLQPLDETYDKPQEFGVLNFWVNPE